MTDATLRALETAARSPHIGELLTFWVHEAAMEPSDRLGLFLSEGDRWLRFLPEKAPRDFPSLSDDALSGALTATEPILFEPGSSAPCGAVLCRFAGRDSWRGVLVLAPSGRKPSATDAAYAQELALAIGRTVTALRRAETTRLQAVALERARLAAELHDGLLQSILSARMQAEVCVTLEEELSPKLPASLKRTHDLLGYTVAAARRFLLDLRLPPENVEDFVPWLHEYAEDFTREYGIAVEVRVEGEGSLSALQAEEAIRLVREALTNVRKHARASGARVTVLFGQESTTISVSDDGVGFDLRSTLERVLDSSHNGLLGMKYRAESIGGEMIVRTQPGKGTTVTFRFSQKRKTGGFEIRRRETPDSSDPTAPAPEDPFSVRDSLRATLSSLISVEDETGPPADADESTKGSGS